MVSRNGYGLLKESAHKLGIFMKCVEIRTEFANLLNLEQYTHKKTNLMSIIPNVIKIRSSRTDIYRHSSN
jgi:hypothetical protein